MRWFSSPQKALGLRALSSSTASNLPLLTLYSYKICPFCNKVKAAARYAQLSMKNVEVNPLTKSEIAFSKEHRKVPIVVTEDGSLVVESDRIVDLMLKDKKNDKVFYSEAAQEWSQWASKDLAVYMYPNITRSFAECRTALAYADTAFSPLQAFFVKNVGAFGMSMAHGAIKKKYNISDERTALYERLDIWQDQIQDGPFRAGNQLPDLADLTVFGVLMAVDGLPAHNDIMSSRPKLAEWYNRMNSHLPPLLLL